MQSCTEIILIGLLCWSCATVSGQVRYPCGELGSEEVKFLNHATNCSQYVICIGGEARIRDCAPGLRFDVEEGVCKPDAICTVEDLDCPLYDDPTELIFHPHADTCDQFWMCANGKPMERRCAQGLHWDRVNQWCTFPDDADCPNRVTCPAEGIFYLPHPSRCELYYVCLNGAKQLAECADGLIFDIDRVTCFFEDQSTCVVDSTSN